MDSKKKELIERFLELHNATCELQRILRLNLKNREIPIG